MRKPIVALLPIALSLFCVLGCGLALTACSSPAPSADTTQGSNSSEATMASDGSQNYQLVTPDQARQLIAQGGLTVIDVREPSEYSSGHLRGAINVPLGTIEQATTAMLPSSLPDRSDMVMVYCRTGVRSKKAADQLVSLGYTKVYDLQGGITAWSGGTTGGGDSCTASPGTSLAS